MCEVLDEDREDVERRMETRRVEGNDNEGGGKRR